MRSSVSVGVLGWHHSPPRVLRGDERPRLGGCLGSWTTPLSIVCNLPVQTYNFHDTNYLATGFRLTLNNLNEKKQTAHPLSRHVIPTLLSFKRHVFLGSVSSFCVLWIVDQTIWFNWDVEWCEQLEFIPWMLHFLLWGSITTLCLSWIVNCTIVFECVEMVHVVPLQDICVHYSHQIKLPCI